jgi:CheY-like chemotaxis protein
VSGVEKMLRRLIGEDVRLTVRLAMRGGAVRVDVGQIEQVIMNLVVNARDAMPRGGEITMETACVALSGEAAIRRGVAEGCYARLRVRDTGTGMDEETRARAFEPFFTTKGPGRGTGLGLATCYGIVRQSGGSIDVQSEVGRGTTFEIHLPLHSGAIPVGPPTERREERPAEEETVLLVEDEPFIRQALQRILTHHGYTVLTARDGDEAHEVVGAHTGSIDVILSDVVMPGQSGPEIMAWALERFPDAKALLMSGYTTHPMLTDDTAPLPFHFLQKPFSPESLVCKLREVLDA